MQEGCCRASKLLMALPALLPWSMASAQQMQPGATEAGSAPREQQMQAPQLGAQTGPTAQERSVPPDCSGLPDHVTLTETLRTVVSPGDKQANGGLGNHMWATVVNREGVACTVTRSGEEFGDQWPGSRAISAAKAFTANAFSLAQFALSTANLYWPSQPGQSLYGLEQSHPPDPEGILVGEAPSWGTPNDPLVGRRSGGAVVFGGGLALYSPDGEIVGAIGLSGDESCTDHVIAWKVRHRLNLDSVPDGVTDESDDNIIHDITTDPASGQDESSSGYGHPTCSPAARSITENFSETHPVGPAE